MYKNFKKRTLTSVILLITLTLMFFNNYILGYVLLTLGIFAVLEFFNLIKIIIKKSKLKIFLSNIIFIIYIFIFCSILLILSFYIHLKILIFLILLTCIASDIGGYIFGKIFKGRKLTKISPNKTISGSIGSLIFSSLIISLLSFYLTKELDILIMIVGLITSTSCQVGDLIFSYLKRKSNLKDTGNLLPGHGGILDRIDGILLGLPLGFLSLIIIY
tara:strand:- start:73 stop:723 length:651 start_codon:yes stop_codon:yes gene_type:complete